MNKRLKKILIGDFTLKRLISSVIFIYLCLALFAYFFSERMMFFPDKSSYVDSSEIIKLKSENGTEISAIYLPNAAAKFTILFSHGNGEDLGDIRGFLELLQDSGFSVFAYDYDGYGTSEGSPSETKAYDDEDAAYDYLVTQLNVPPERIIAHGRSLGGAMAIDLASRKKVGGLIAESSFVTAFRVVTKTSFFPFDRFRNIDKIKKIKCPVLIMHGKDDRLIAFWHGEKLFETANEPKMKLWVEGAGHNDLMQQADADYLTAIDKFANMIQTTKQVSLQRE